MPDALPIVHLDGELLPLAQARIPVLDRGFLYGDGVYEVIACYHGRPFLEARHLARLRRSLAGIRCRDPLPGHGWSSLVAALLAANPPAAPAHAGRLAVYLQVTRGDAAGRTHVFPEGVSPRVFAMCLENPPPAPHLLSRGAGAVTQADERWSRCDIKATSLLGNVLAREEAARAGVAEALLHRNGRVTEGATSNVIAWVEDTLVSPPDGPDVLPGVTRDWVLEQAAAAGIPCARRELTLGALMGAGEVWLTSTTREILPVTRIDDQRIGTGEPGPRWRAALERFHASLPGAPAGTADQAPGPQQQGDTA